MVKKLWKNVVCVGMVCLIVVPARLVQPVVEQQDCREIIVTPRDYNGNENRED